MKKNAWLGVFLLMIAGCSQQGSLVEKVVEGGVKPYHSHMSQALMIWMKK
jgi:hypothetical protein